jgi:glutamine amidotransferase
MIAIVDYGMGNLKSIQNMLKVIGFESIITCLADDIKTADKLILPGVGAFDNAVQNIERLKLREILQAKVLEEKTPIMGICLGMQLLTDGSEEGELAGLGFLKGKTVRFNFNGQNGRHKIPHMGWNTVNLQKKSRLFENMYPESRFYFVHSYHVISAEQQDSLCSTLHGYEFTSAVEKDNIFGVQFHPEKSHKFGMKLLNNFAELKQDVKNAGNALLAAK